MEAVIYDHITCYLFSSKKKKKTCYLHQVNLLLSFLRVKPRLSHIYEVTMSIYGDILIDVHLAQIYPSKKSN